MTRPIRTRIAPSPTGFLHLGTARTALFSWAFARHHGGTFILRIEDTDVARSTQEAVDAIIASMQWLGLDYDEGPFYQMQRLDRYRAVLDQMLADGTAYHCYCSPVELDAMRERQRAAGEKPRYDGTWRPGRDKPLPPVPAGVKPVVRFRNPQDGDVTWTDMVKGPISFSNRELDDLIIARPDGTPTYNFCVVVDDWDMGITHVIRGDDHVNNTPRQINILRALGVELPQYGHVPMILGPDGEKLSKRHGAVSVTQYDDAGFLPEAMINYLARLGWSHGDDELFSREQLVNWFDTEHLAKSPAQWDPKKLAWVNSHYLKQAAPQRVVDWLIPRLTARGLDLGQGPALLEVVGLLKDRAETMLQIADDAAMFYAPLQLDPALAVQHLTDSIKPALASFVAAIDGIDWTKEAIAATLKSTLAAHALKMPQLAVPLRVAVTGRAHTPSVDAVLWLMGRGRVIERIQACI
jgi:glutamyl-tRNA synthetase